MEGLVALLCLHASPWFEPPFRASAGGESIDVEIGHAAPLYTDFDGDGVSDLLVGQFGNGRLRIYRNLGTLGAPRFEHFEWFRAGEAFGTIPSG